MSQNPGDQEATILIRLFTKEDGPLPPEAARYLLNLHFSDRDKARMHDLSLRNQDDALSAAEKEEMFAYGKAGCLLAILHSKARRTLGIRTDGKPGPDLLLGSMADDAELMDEIVEDAMRHRQLSGWRSNKEDFAALETMMEATGKPLNILLDEALRLLLRQATGPKERRQA